MRYFVSLGVNHPPAASVELLCHGSDEEFVGNSGRALSEDRDRPFDAVVVHELEGFSIGDPACLEIPYYCPDCKSKSNRNHVIHFNASDVSCGNCGRKYAVRTYV